MITRRSFAAGMMTEMAFAQRAAVKGPLAADMVWLNANENPDGPPAASIAAMEKILRVTGRYHYQEYGDFYAAVAGAEDLAADQVLVGSGSSEVLHAAVDAFTSPARPLIVISPTYEGPIDVAKALGHPVIRVPLTPAYGADVKKLVEEAGKAGGGLIYMCNPNNPTSSITPKSDVAWLVSHLPPNTIALIDEAYHHFNESPQFASAIDYVRRNKNVVLSRSYSKIYGMAGLRCGYVCARPDLIRQMEPFRNNVISYVAVQAVLAAIADAPNFIPRRRAKLLKTRRELCAWFREKNLKYIEPHANFVMFDVGRESRPLIAAMAAKGVAAGRPFPPLDSMIRVSIGTDRDMERFREVFWSVYNT